MAIVVVYYTDKGRHLPAWHHIDPLVPNEGTCLHSCQVRNRFVCAKREQSLLWCLGEHCTALDPN